MIHPTAEIEKGACIAPNVIIGAFCRIGKDVTLENGVKLEHHIQIDGHITIGKDTHIFSFAKIGAKNISVEIGQKCNIREFAQIGINLKAGAESIVIGDSCYIMAYADIRPGVIVEEGCIITNNVILHKRSRCEKNVILGAKASVDADCTIGTGCMVGGASSVTHDMPPFCLIEGSPLASIRGLNLVGMRRNFQNRSSITYLKRAFRTLKEQHFDSGKAKKMLPQIQDIPTKIFVSFVAQHDISI